MRSSPILLGLALAASASSSVGCSVISDLDRFEQSTKVGADAAMPDQDGASADAAGSDAGVGLGCGNPATLCLQLSGFDEYKGKLVVIDLVTETGELRARAMLDSAADKAKQAVVLPLAIPTDEIPSKDEDPPLHVEVWADKDGDRRYSVDKDEGFRIGLTADAVVEYTRVEGDLVELTPPTDRDGDFSMKLSGFLIHASHLFEAMVIDTKTGRTLGLARIDPVASDGMLTVEIPGILDTTDSELTIEFYADDGNGMYDGVGPDHSWIIERRSGAGGLNFARTHSAPKTGPEKDDPSFKFAELTYQFPFEQ